MSIGTIIVGSVLLVVVGAISRKLIIDKLSGKTTCKCGTTTCASCSACTVMSACGACGTSGVSDEKKC